MALTRLAMIKNLQQKLSTSATHPLKSSQAERLAAPQILRRLLSTAAEEKKEGGGSGHEVAVSEGGKKHRLFPRRKRGRSLWRRSDDRDFVPAIWDLFPSGLGNAVIQATENMNRLMENLSPSNLIGRAREHDDHYKLRYHVPGLGKEDVKITVEDGVLNIRGEHKEEDEEGSDDEFWSTSSSSYYNAAVVLPDDAKVDEIKAELKDGVLNIVVPKSEKANKDVKEIQVK